MQKVTLKEIVQNKKIEIARKKRTGYGRFFDAIRSVSTERVSLIAEVKLASPSMGKLGALKNVQKRVYAYEKAHADCLSVVVDEKYFSGSYTLLRNIRSLTTLPILSKDFVIDPIQICEAKSSGADAVLLIAKILSLRKLNLFVRLVKSLGMDPVVEVSTDDELTMAFKTPTKIIAVNARDLDTFEINIDDACRILTLIPKHYTVLAFSGVQSRKDVEHYVNYGAKGVLVGTSLMRSHKVDRFIRSLKQI